MPSATKMAMGYRATMSPDELVIHDVPIFCECSRHGKDFDSKWIKAAVAEAKIGQDDGHFAPLNLLHHPLPGEAEVVPTHLGHYEVTGISKISFRGRQVSAVMADLHVKKEEFFDQILKGHFPYRSVEIYNRDVAKIDCLSLLDHEPPFLELPMLMVTDIQRFRARVSGDTLELDYTQDAPDRGTPIVASSAIGSRIHVFSRFDGEVTMVQTAKKPDQKSERLQSDDEEKKSGDGEKKENMEDGGGGDGGPDVGAVVKAIKSGLIGIADFAEIKMAMEEAEAWTKSEPDEEQPAPAAVPGAESMSKESSPELIRMQAKIAALEARDAAREEQQAVKDDVDSAYELLKDRPMGADPRGKLLDLRQKMGRENFKIYVDEFSKTFGALPVDLTAGLPMTARQAKIPEELLKKYTTPDEQEKVENFCAQWTQARQNGFARQDQVKWVSLRMERDQQQREEG